MSISIQEPRYRRMYGRTDVGNFSRFYRTLFPIDAAAQKVKFFVGFFLGTATSYGDGPVEGNWYGGQWPHPTLSQTSIQKTQYSLV